MGKQHEPMRGQALTALSRASPWIWLWLWLPCRLAGCFLLAGMAALQYRSSGAGPREKPLPLGPG